MDYSTRNLYFYCCYWHNLTESRLSLSPWSSCPSLPRLVLQTYKKLWNAWNNFAIVSCHLQRLFEADWNFTSWLSIFLSFSAVRATKSLQPWVSLQCLQQLSGLLSPSTLQNYLKTRKTFQSAEERQLIWRQAGLGLNHDLLLAKQLECIVYHQGEINDYLKKKPSPHPMIQDDDVPPPSTHTQMIAQREQSKEKSAVTLPFCGAVAYGIGRYDAHCPG